MKKTKNTLKTGGKNLSSLKERVDVVDAVRGLALFGMLIANVGVFTHSRGTGINDIASNIYTIFILNNYYVIFAMLFGLSFYIFMTRPKNTKFIFLKRTFILLIIGVGHLLFLWHLDILHAYALTGFLLIFFYDMKLKYIKICILLMFVLDVLFSSFLSSDILEHLLRPTTATTIDTYSAGSYLENLSMTFENLPNLFAYTLVEMPRYLFLFLIGLYMGKTGIYAETRERLDQILSWCRISLGATVVVSLIWVLSLAYQLGDTVTDPLTDLFNFLLACFYVTFFILLYHTRKVDTGGKNFILDRFSYIGKMTLTNYVSHSVIYLILFYDFHLGLRHEYPTYLVPLIAIPLFFLQAELSRIWIERFGHGPLEKIWRYLTYFSLSLREEKEQKQ